MPESPWTYDRASKRFRDERTGRYLAASTAVDLRDGFQERRRADADALARRLADRDLSVQDWEAGMRSLVRHAYAAQYAYGRGGLNAMTDADWRAADDLAAAQWAYLRGFALDAAAGKLSEAQLTARAHLYYAGSVQAYERGRASAWNVSPPHVPGDGSTPCKSSCRCRLDYRETDTTVELRWRLRSGESCSGCTERASTWAPLVLAKPADRSMPARLYRLLTPHPSGPHRRQSHAAPAAARGSA